MRAKCAYRDLACTLAKQPNAGLQLRRAVSIQAASKEII
jgi:hypothetical protein